MKKITPPNYTQMPNIFLDDMVKEMKPAELRVALVIMRETFGWHREWRKLSLTYLMQATGMSKQGVINGINSGIERGVIERQKDKGGFSYHLVVNEVDQRTNVLVNEVDRTSQRSRPLLVNEVDPTKKEKKEEKKEPPAPASLNGTGAYRNYRQQQAAEHVKAAKEYGLLPDDFTNLVDAYLLACGTMATANADTDLGERELRKAKDAAVTGLACGILEPPDVEKRLKMFQASWGEEKIPYYSQIVNQSIGKAKETEFVIVAADDEDGIF